MRTGRASLAWRGAARPEAGRVGKGAEKQKRWLVHALWQSRMGSSSSYAIFAPDYLPFDFTTDHNYRKWIDTCCIDKSSSAELSEAINSMFRWYRNADVCYAFLSDVNADEVASAYSSSFRKSRLFTRGWSCRS